MIYSYSVNTIGQFNKQAYLQNGTYYEATGTQTDWAGRSLKSGSLTPGTGSVSSLASCVLHSFVSNEYNSIGQMIKSTDPDGVATLMAYNPEGESVISTIDLNQNNQIDYGVDTLTYSVSEPALDSANNPVMRTISKAWQPGDNNPAGGTVTSISESAPNGLSITSQSIGVANSSSTVTTLSGNGNWTITRTSPNGTKEVQQYTNGLLTSSSSLDTSSSILHTSFFSYDSLNRTITETDARIGTTTTIYLSSTADIVTSLTDPENRTTSFTYDTHGRQISVNAPDTLDSEGNILANITTTSYFPDGNVSETDGDQTYRVSYTYDYADRQIGMTTYGTEIATVTWQYSPDRGFLLAKRDAANKGATYTYTAAGRLATRTWARGVTTTYSYDNGGRIVSTNYSDSTPDLTMSYDAIGRQTTQSNGIATSIFTYNSGNLQIDTETIAYDLDSDNTTDFTRVIDRSQDTLGRESGWQLKNGVTVENSVAYTYSNTDGRLSSISNPSISNIPFNYTYELNSSLIKTVTSPTHTVTNSWEANRDVLQTKENKVGSTLISGYTYNVNHLGQRTGVDQSGTAFQSVRSVEWSYNSKGEVVKSDSSVPGFDRAYLFDGIGNRVKSADSLTLPVSNNYTPNALNQYTVIDALNPVHDDDGNMTSGPLPTNVNSNSTLTWDGENRLIQAQVNSGGTVSNLYDSQSRRIAETVGTNTTLYVYDGWNPIAEYTISNNQYSISRSFTWGIDLSGSMQGAGGVGGLLAVAIHDQQSTIYYPTYDGNGNVSEYLDSAGAIAAHYEYDPFGKTTVATGPKANDFAHRFSTKPLDTTTGLHYYGYRFYDPQTGRWPSRDPIEERGGINLYGFLGNSTLISYDVVGLWKSLGNDIWSAEAGDTLGGLASKNQYGGNGNNWPCLWPVGNTRDNGYPNIDVGDCYSAENLVVPQKANKLQFMTEDDFLKDNLFGYLYNSGTPASDIPSLIRNYSVSGAHPITELLIEGHGPCSITGDTLSGTVGGVHSTTTVNDIILKQRPPTFIFARAKWGPARCWFSRDATVRLGGCKTRGIAYSFAKGLLRKGCKSWGTMHSIYAKQSTFGKPRLCYKDASGREECTAKGAAIHSKTWIGFGGEL